MWTGLSQQCVSTAETAVAVGGERSSYLCHCSLQVSEFPLEGPQCQDFLIWTQGQCNISWPEDSSVQLFR